MIRWIQEHKSTLFGILGYLTFSVILLTVFIYLTFPWQKLSRFIEFQVEQALDSTIEIQKSEFRFPLKLVWTGVAFKPREAGKAVRVDLDKISRYQRNLRSNLPDFW